MIEFTRMELTNFSAHYVGNKGLGEALQKSDFEFEFKDDYAKDSMVRYLLKGFNNDIYYEFNKHQNEVSFHDVKSYVSEIFKDKKKFLENSQHIAEHLYNQSMHPKIKGGELYFTYLKEVMVDGVICDAVGIFKSETVDTFIKVDIVPSQNSNNGNESIITTDSGCGLDKLDRGVLIFNIESESGYKISVVDRATRASGSEWYWVQDFLGVKLKDNSYLKTKHYLNQCVSFCDEVLTEENNVSKMDRQSILNKSVNFFNDNDVFDEAEFIGQVLGGNEEIAEAFKEHKKAYQDVNDVDLNETFDVSKTAVKEQKKNSKTVIKLDKNFHLYVHGRHELLEKGYDEEKGMKFYKVYYINEEM